MKKLNFLMAMLFFFVLSVFPLAGWAQLLIGESFDYTPDAVNGLDQQSNGVWKVLGSGDSILVTGGNLSYPGLPISSGNKISFDGGGSGCYRIFTGQSASDAIYGSIIFSISSLPTSTTGDYFIYFGNQSAITTLIYLRASSTSGKFNIGLAKRNNIKAKWLTNELDLNTSYYVVFSYSVVGGVAKDDITRLWLNPTNLTHEPKPDVSVSAAADVSVLSNLNRIILNHGSDNENMGLKIDIDELRVSTDWATASAPMPITLGKFQVQAVVDYAIISWTTFLESNNDHFEVERSADGTYFETIARVESKGTTSNQTEYFVYDHNPQNGINYYRLVQYDKDGVKTYFGIKKVSFNLGREVTLKVYPVPATSKITIALKNYSGGKLNVTLSSANNELIHKEVIEVPGAGEFIYPLHLLKIPSPGIYWLKITDGAGLNESAKVLFSGKSL